MSTLGASAQIARAEAARDARARGALLLAVPVAMALVVLGASTAVLFTPAWVHFAIDASGGGSWAPSAAVAHELSDRTIGELLLGPATFTFAGPDGSSLYTADEAAHLRDVRVVLLGFIGLAGLALALVVWAIRRHGDEPSVWRTLAHGALALAVGLLVVGVIAALAFGAAFELFHRLLFPGGNFSFPADSRLVGLYPIGFWQLSAAALGVLGVGGGLLVWWAARRRASALDGQPTMDGPA